MPYGVRTAEWELIDCFVRKGYRNRMEKEVAMYTVVVADDEEDLRKAIIRKIRWEEIGFSVVGEAENGIEALELVERLEPDLLLSDIRMPFVTGIELARQVREVRPATQIAFLSGYDDFTYAQQAIQYNIISYMLKPISMAGLTEDLIRIKEKIDQLFREFSANHKARIDVDDFLLPLLLDSFQTDISEEREERLLAAARECGFLEESGENLNKYMVLTVSLWNQDKQNCTKQDHRYAVNSILQKYMKYNSFYIEGRIVCVLKGTRASLEKYVHILAEDILQSVERILALHCQLGVSREAEKLTGLHEAYRESCNAMRYADPTVSGIHYIADEEPPGGLDVEYTLDAVSAVEDLIRAGSGEELEAFLQRLFGGINTRISSRARINFLLVELLSCVCKLLYTVPEGNSLLMESAYMQQMQFLEGPLAEAAEKFREFCVKVQEALARQRKKSSMDICDKALRLVEEQYADPSVSLLSISSQIGVSPNYLSALIKKKTGKTFVDFLTQKRIEQARKLLLDTSMKIREISEKCGYSDQHYFSYCFKKCEGISPNMLRQQNSGENV